MARHDQSGTDPTTSDPTRSDLTTSEVARALRLNRATVQRMLAAGRLRGYQIGRSWRVPRAALEEFRRMEEFRLMVREPGGTYGGQEAAGEVITGRKAWLKAFKALSGSVAVPAPSASSLRREELYEDHG